MKLFLKNVLFYAVVVIIDMVLLALFMRINIFSGTVIYYYRTLYSAALVVIITLVLLIVLAVVFKKKNVHFIELDPTMVASTTVISGLVLAMFVTVAPMNIDRSYTVFTLADMYENSDTVYTKQELQERFIEIYIKDYDSVSRRLSEQISIGNIEEVDGGYRITEKGKTLVEIFRFVDMLYPVEEKREIYPEYSFDKDNSE